MKVPGTLAVAFNTEASRAVPAGMDCGGFQVMTGVALAMVKMSVPVVFVLHPDVTFRFAVQQRKS